MQAAARIGSPGAHLKECNHRRDGGGRLRHLLLKVSRIVGSGEALLL